jgi:ferredoxin--NADP+ reductase
MNRTSTPGTDILNATIIERKDLNEELAIVRIQPDGGVVPDFQPGQFCTIGLPKAPEEIDPQSPAVKRGKVPLIRRAYSIASSPMEKDALELYIVLVEAGRLTSKLWELNQGDRLFLDPRINGHFTLEPIPPGKDLIFVSTGTGLAPFISMLRTFRGSGRWRRCVVLHGVRMARDLGYREELTRIAAEDSTVTYIPAVTREPADSDYPGYRGRVNQALEAATYEKLVGAPLDPAHCHVLLCGNPAMIDTVQAELSPLGFTEHKKDQPGTLHFERYW